MRGGGRSDFQSDFYKCFIIDLLMQHGFCCVYLIYRTWRTWKTNQITPKYLIFLSIFLTNVRVRTTHHKYMNTERDWTTWYVWILKVREYERMRVLRKVPQRRMRPWVWSFYEKTFHQEPVSSSYITAYFEVGCHFFPPLKLWEF